MLHEFSRTELLIGSDGIEQLKMKKVMIFGVGGVGSHCVEALARSGVGHLILVDNDTVALTNLNRQVVGLHSTIGHLKTEVMKERILDINPAAVVETIETFVLADNLAALIPEGVDFIIDAIDTVTAKIAIAAYARQQDIPLISSMGTGNKLDPQAFRFADIYQTAVCPLCKVMRRELKKRGIKKLKVLYSEEQPLTPEGPEEETNKRTVPGSISFVPPVAGLLIAGETIKALLREE